MLIYTEQMIQNNKVFDYIKFSKCKEGFSSAITKTW